MSIQGVAVTPAPMLGHIWHSRTCGGVTHSGRRARNAHEPQARMPKHTPMVPRTAGSPGSGLRPCGPSAARVSRGDMPGFGPLRLRVEGPRVADPPRLAFVAVAHPGNGGVRNPPSQNRPRQLSTYILLYSLNGGRQDSLAQKGAHCINVVFCVCLRNGGASFSPSPKQPACHFYAFGSDSGNEPPLCIRLVKKGSIRAISTSVYTFV